MSIDSSRIIVALDFPHRSKAEDFLSKVKGKIQTVKVGPVLFCKEGPHFVQQLSLEGFDVFLDLKFHDIPNTVKGAVEAACSEMDLRFLTVHASGGSEMIQAARKGAPKSTKILAVTVLTSLDVKNGEVEQLASMAVAAGSDGIVCSPQEIRSVKSKIKKDALLVVPGIRNPKEQGTDDQKRTATAAEAIEWGANYLVIGRPITQATDPVKALEELTQ